MELWITEKDESVKIVFSGDLGKKDQLIVRDPHEIFDADYLFVESTYGDRLHRTFEDSKAELLEAINMSFGDLEDPNSDVSRLLQSRRHHALLVETGTRPQIYYLT